MFAAFLPKIGALVAQRAVQAVGAGLLSGAVVGGAGVASGLIPMPGPQAAPTVALLACPGSGPELGRVSSGQTLLVTARSGDGSWLEVYVGAPGVAKGWVPASGLRLQAAAELLPVQACGLTAVAQPSLAPTVSVDPTQPPPSVEATAVGSLVPDLTPSPKPTVTPAPSARPKSTPTATPTPKPTLQPTPKPAPTPTPTPKPTPTPDLTNPTLSNMHVNNTCIGPDIASSTVSVTATDPDDPIDHVQFGYQMPGQESWLVTTMAHAGGTTWQFTFTYSSSMSTGGYIGYYATAIDSNGNASSSIGDDIYSSNNLVQVAPSGCIIG